MSTLDDINAAFEAWLEQTEPAETSTHEGAESPLRCRRFGAITAALENEANYLVLCHIRTEPAHRGQGQATALLRTLKALCDRYGVILLAQATAYDDAGLDQRALLSWYERHGFVVDRERTSQPLVWYPRKPSP